MVYLKWICHFIIILSFQGIALQALSLECISRRLARVETNMMNSSVIVAGNGSKLIYNIDGFQSIEILSPSENVRIINRINNKAIQRSLTISEKELVATLKNALPGGIPSIVKKCQSIPEKLTHKQLMMAPLTPLEIQECKSYVNKISDIRDCIENNNCEKMYSRHYEEGTPKKAKKYSFQKMIQTGSGLITPKRVAILTGSALGYTVDAITIRALFKHGGKIVAHSGRLGLAAAGTGAVFLSYAIPWTFYLFVGNNKCSEQDLLEDNGATSECVQYSNKALKNTFSQTLNEAIQDPNKFLKTISHNKNGTGARIACSILEGLSDQWDRNVASISCQGRTLDFGKHRSYFVAEDQHIYRHKNIDYTYHFENLPHYRIEKRTADIPDLRVKKEIQAEAEELNFLKPRIKEVIKTCSAFKNSNEVQNSTEVEY